MPQATSAKPKRKPPAKHRNAYRIPQKADALAKLEANNGNILKTATEFGVRESTLRGWVEQAQRDTEQAARVRALRDEKCAQLVPVTEDVCWAAARQVLDKLPDSSARDAAVTFGIFNQHRMALLGAPTQRIVVEHRNPALVGLSDAQFDAALALLSQAAGPVVDALPLALTTGERVGGEAVDADAERAGEPGRSGERGLTGAGQQMTDARQADAAPTGELGRGDGLVIDHGPQERAERGD